MRFPYFQRPLERHSWVNFWKIVFAVTILVSFIQAPTLAQDRSNTGGIGITILSGGYFIEQDNDVRKTYGVIPTIGFRIAKIFATQNEIFLNVEYSNTSGDPYYDHPDFISSLESKLKVAPIKCGVRFIAAQTSDFRVYVGAGLSLYWIEEKTPGLYETTPADYSGIGLGVNALLAPELRFSENKYAVGLELSLGKRNVEMSDNHTYQDISMSGWALRGYVSTHLF